LAAIKLQIASCRYLKRKYERLSKNKVAPLENRSLEMSENRISFTKGVKAAKLSTIVLLTLGTLKGIVAIVSGSVALLAGAIDSFSDVLSSIAVWAGLRIAKKKPTERFPYGYYKAETFALLTVSLILVASSILIMLESFQKFFEVNIISFSDIALSCGSVIRDYLLSAF
jgi:divalent metal cation (Fe/Co/Zn/Cd) transporter